ncbi:TonB-dependent receptor plug domain-containing protein [Sulfurimonas marina]|uniref:TonB-dependent receptor n=1 Tax=Sulfurimonas marina TaxID=2590551 RepID=A0A7M1AWG3_9BACT|nr:TonB-dependent receptor [Sulfurimonas marina]QOP41764.1 TonB-dependent receptor [Sulfurimonas marina]
MKKKVLLLSALTSIAMADSFELGQVSVKSTIDDVNVFEEKISSDTISKHDSFSVNEALDNVSGINQDIQGGRGESTLYIRGFDSRRIGVFIDGIPVYVPYDGNFDYGRFLTGDIGEIDISKGYSSVVFGGNTMGGVVNIVSKKPTKELEGNVKGTIVFDSQMKMARHIENVNVGTKQQNFYAQLSASYSKQDHFRISDEYEATPTQPAGDRLRSENEDKKVSLKVGYIADDKSEVAITYANQKGQKQQPPVTDTDFAKNKNWDWPYWNKETISIVGQKNFDTSYIKALAYYDTSENSLYSYDDNTFTTLSQKWAWKSRYDDYSYGARLEYVVQNDNNIFTAAANYKKDVHRAYDISKTDSSETLEEKYADHTISLGLEDTYDINSNFQILGALSYDQRSGDQIYDTNTDYQDMLEKTTQSSLNPELALIYKIDKTSKVRLSAASKTYMPSMKDRYSRRLGTAVPNPDLKDEKSIHYELSYTKKEDKYFAQVNTFYTKVKDTIQSVVWDQNTSLNQNQNIGTFDHIGAEIELRYKYDTLEVGGNYTYLKIKNTTDADVKLVDVPENQVFAFIQKELVEGFSLYANTKYRQGAYEQKLDKSYVINPYMLTFDLKAIYQPTKNLQAQIGVKNLTDELIRYDMAYPMAGREYFASLDYKF